jgi:hypothetical protein
VINKFIYFIFFSISLECSAQIDLNLSTLTSKPIIFGRNAISTGKRERDFAISPDGLEIMYTIQSPNGKFSSIVNSRKSKAGNWTKPEIVSFSGQYSDLEPAYSHDGKFLFFSSNRPVKGNEIKDFDIWTVEQINGKWSNPKVLGNHINSRDDEFYPSVSKNGNLYFTATYKNGVGKEDIWFSKWENEQFGEPIPMDTAINSKKYEFNAFIDPEEDYIIFSSYGRKDDTGGGDLYLSIKNENGIWQPAQNLTLLNSKKIDYCPFVTADQRQLFFTSERDTLNQTYFKQSATIHDFENFYSRPNNGFGDIYVVDFSTITKDSSFISLLVKKNQQVGRVKSDTSHIALAKLASEITSSSSNTFDKVKSIIAWTNTNLDWTYTDYKKRNVIQILARKGGNCNEQAIVVRALLTELNIKTRKAVEVNIQPAREQRRKDAEAKIKEVGNRASVFGFRHNDHVWIEYFDEQNNQWIPADPTLNLIGYDLWVKARIGFEPRVTHSIVASADMLVPIAIFALNTDGTIAEDRSEYYLIESFNNVYNHNLEKANIWSKWKEKLVFIQSKCRAAFEGKENLHLYDAKIKEIEILYKKLKNIHIQSKNK